MKRIIALFLVLCLIVLLCPQNISATADAATGKSAQIQIATMRMQLKNELQADFAFKASDLPERTGYYAIVTQQLENGTRTTTIPSSQWYTEGDYVAIPYTNMAAKEMTDEISITIYNAADEAISAPYTSTLAEYAGRAFAQAAGKMDFAAMDMYVSMLYYGAAAQEAFNYKKAHKATDDMTNAMKAFVNNMGRTTADLNKAPDTGSGGTVGLLGSRAILESNIQLQLGFRPDFYDRGFTATYSYVNHLGQTVEGSLPMDIMPDGSYSIITVDTLVIADCSQLVTVNLLTAQGDRAFTVCDSVENFAIRMVGGTSNNAAQKTLAQEIMNFSTSAYKYFHAGEETEDVCETAQECMDNLTVGWNLGCSLSVATQTNFGSFTGMIGMSTSDGKYSRSDVAAFHQTTGSLIVDWQLGKDNGIVNAASNAKVNRLFVEQWNFSLGETDTLVFSVDEFRYTLASGKTISMSRDQLGTFQTDMSDGTGVGYLLESEDLGDLRVSDIVSIRCKMTILELKKAPHTPDRIAEIEQGWGNPVTTQEMIDVVCDRGFNMIRIQVSYYNHMDAQGNINALWMDRVQEVVDYCMNNGVYCVINTSGIYWLTANKTEWAAAKPIYIHVWQQIAERFADYGELLLFESCNEVLNRQGQWWYPTQESYDVMYDIHQTFVDTVRASGGYNETRNLMLNPYGAAYDYDMNKNFKLPKDTVKDHLIAQVHLYVPQDFTFNETNLGSTNFRYEWGTDADKKQLDDVMKGIKKRFIDELGVPVVIGEFGIAKRISASEAAEYMTFYGQTANKYGIGLILFDDGLDIAVFDRNNLVWTRPEVVDALFATNT